MKTLTVLALIGLTAAGSSLASCGRRAGTLEQPAPLWGARAKAEYEAQREAREGPEKTSPASRERPMDPAQAHRSISSQPLEGGPNNPRGGGPANSPF